MKHHLNVYSRIKQLVSDTLKDSDDSGTKTNKIKVKSAKVISPGIDTLKGSDDSNDQTNDIKVESVHNIILDIIKEMFDQIAINDDQLYFEAIEKSVHDGKKPVPAPRRDLKSSLSSTKEKKKVFGQSEFRSYATKAYEKD